MLEGSHIVLHDINPTTLAEQRERQGLHCRSTNCLSAFQRPPTGPEPLRALISLIISIQVGNRFDLWEQDWRIPQQYGVQQVYGENGGPGGLFLDSMRIIPPILEICADIISMAQATVFNFSNPMEPHLHHRDARLPHLKFIGLCHEIGSLRNFLPPHFGRA